MFSYRLIDPQKARAHAFSMPLRLHIREIRSAQKLTLATVAGRAGISIVHLSQVERGDKNLNNHLMEKIAGALGVQPEDLVSGSDDTPEGEARVKLQKAIQGLSTAEALAKVADYAETLALAEKAGKQTL